MKKIENYLNILHFCVFKVNHKFYLLYDKIDPFNFIHKLPFQKKRYEKLGINPIKKFNNIFENKTYGFSVTVAGGLLLGILFLFFWGVVNFLIGAPEGFISLTTPHMLISIFLSVSFSYLFVFKQDKYLIYFKKFELWPKSAKVKYSLISFGFIVAVFCFLILSIRWS